jgi:hypothetical protein
LNHFELVLKVSPPMELGVTGSFKASHPKA